MVSSVRCNGGNLVCRRSDGIDNGVGSVRAFIFRLTGGCSSSLDIALPFSRCSTFLASPRPGYTDSPAIELYRKLSYYLHATNVKPSHVNLCQFVFLLYSFIPKSPHYCSQLMQKSPLSSQCISAFLMHL